MTKKINNGEWLYDENGNKSGIKIKFKDFQKTIEELENLHDLYVAYQHKGKKLKTIPFEKVLKEALAEHAKK